ncbi:Alkylmercury lyase [Amycolatopsis tolypomycina]|uniref:Alkylmercury lyase n=1 Tax=Amycolatopsis tolypomycina TaxID=208445 RepID=A0A1H4JMS8_9PSEU|nr:alkylmercury lyase family protein [Amycolatopsis tolypomycina]SEB46998.1 Alkylmercury lyase [Amycolatopsis tolypomycina]
MKIDILHVPDCPNLSLLQQRLHQALDTAIDDPTMAVSTVVIPDLEAATATGMTGSPTLLIDGTDPFAEAGSGPSLSCRLYRDPDGRVTGAPSVAALRDALVGHAGSGSPCDAGPCCTSASHETPPRSLQDWRARAAPADPAERAIHHTILRSFATTGAAPGPTTLDHVAAPFGTSASAVLRQLHERDTIRLGPDARIRAAYPFSAVPTRHRVHLAGGPTVEAMCVIDALGIPAMLDTDAAITTTAPTGGHPITVSVTGGRTTWNPATAVVFLSAYAGGGPSADNCCGYLNAFPDRDAGESWAAAHLHIPGELIDGSQAEQLGRHIFGNLLAAH